VPAVAVIQEEQALFSLIRRKGYVGVIKFFFVKCYIYASIHLILFYWVN